MRRILTAALFIATCGLALAQQLMNNDSVIKLIKAGLSDDLIVSTINGTPGHYDTSADAIIALKTAGASDKVIGAMIAKNSAPASAPAAALAPAGPVRPAGIDDVGVYYSDRKGAWQMLEPEIVNFKTGGFLKSIATDGLVKGDINGHIPGAHAKTILTFPITLAVYVPEGVDIAEYQLLRLRANSNNREFRSVTGGVIHSSGGAERDSVEFKSTKIAPRVYQIVLDQSLGKGEYGLLPPGSYTSSNMASGGKIYSISIPE
ncbi:MAG TPA: hypothetical protein VMT38_03990 [Terracidiphilus sp.]|nr:hypothetical protein [Terracidiphilus sp.]